MYKKHPIAWCHKHAYYNRPGYPPALPEPYTAGSPALPAGNLATLSPEGPGKALAQYPWHRTAGKFRLRNG